MAAIWSHERRSSNERRNHLRGAADRRTKPANKLTPVYPDGSGHYETSDIVRSALGMPERPNVRRMPIHARRLA